MAEKLCTLRKYGGRLKETVLWTNPNPSSGYSGANVTLSSGISNFKKIKLLYKWNASESHEYSAEYLVDDITTMVASPRTSFMTVGGSNRTTYASYMRCVYYVNDTTLNITNAFTANSAGTDSTSALITQIIGLK